MSRQSRLEWFASRASSPAARRRSSRPHRRPLRFEPLEDRRLLALTVTTLVDENDGINVGDVSLREAIAAASPGETIDFSVTGTITLEHGELVIDKSLTIDGPGSDLLILDAAGNDSTPLVDDGAGSRIFRIDDGFFGTPIDVEINGLALTGGDVDGDGGAIESRENLRLADCSLVGNAATNNGGAVFHTGGMATFSTVVILENLANEGGGVYNIGGVVHAFDSIISYNQAAAGGGGILNWLNGELLVSKGTLEGNQAVDGGAIMNRSADFTVVGSSISGNTVTNSGGAIRNSGGTGTVFGSTLSGNTAKYGAGLYVDTELNQRTTISNSTISGNTATDGGGGVYNFVGHVVIQLSTIAGNSAQLNRGGGVVSWGDPAETLTEVYSSIIGNNWDPDGVISNDFDLVGGPVGGPFDTVDSLGYNLVQSGSALGEFNAVGDLTGIDPLLGPLADNGGPLLTHALLIGSPALDAGNPDDEAGVGIVPANDQRTPPYSRVFDSDRDSIARIDIGALESDEVFFVVDSVDDAVDGDYSAGQFSLREAILEANAVTAGTGHILFAPELTSEAPNVLMLSLGQFDVTNRMIVEGPGADRLTVDAQGNSRIFDVDDDVNSTRQDVWIDGLTLTGGSEGGGGGAIFSQERLSLRDSVVTGNSAQWGGGIYNAEYGDLTVLRSQITGNHAVEPLPGSIGSGGGFYNWGGIARIIDTTISGNDSVSHGGGILNANHGTLSITRSTVSDNDAEENGGGLASVDGNVSIDSSTFGGNEAINYGGGIFVNAPAQYITKLSSSTISGNIAPLGGAGIMVEAGHAVIEFSTITANNSNDFAGSGVRASALTEVRSSIIAGNHHTDAASANTFDFESGGYNLVGVFGLGGVFEQPGDVLIGAADPLLGPLADNGGPTFTHALLAGSPAIDAGDPNAVAGIGGTPRFDQRGLSFDRVRDGDAAEDVAIDVGAFEVQQFGVVPELLGDYNRDNTVDAVDYTIWRNTLGNDVEQLYDGADGDGDGKVGDDDYRVWKMHFGESIEIGGSAAGSIELAGSISLDGQILVTTLADTTNFSDGVTSLREAIFAANIVSGPNTIVFDPALTAEQPGTILLTLGELAITDALIIAGPGAPRLTIDASGNDFDRDAFGNGTRIFNIDDQNSDTTFDVEIRDLRLTGGDVAESGGAIVARENFTGVRLVVEGNHAFQGGAVSLIVMTGTSSIIDSDLRENFADGGGGAVEFVGGNLGAAILSGNAIRGNSAKMGGAIFVSQSNPNSTLTIDGNLIAENSAIQQGGAIALISGAVAKTTIRSTTISGNTAGTLGGGIFLNLARDVTIIDSTIADNRSLAQSLTQARGGGIYASGAEFNITASTISGNQASSGGGIFSRNGEVTINFSTFADNDALSGSGGGLYSLNDRLALFGSTITGNTAGGTTTNQGRGGGIWHAPSFVATSRIADTTISDNQASLDGGGLYFRPISETAASNFLTLENLTITGNTALRGGGVATAPSSAGSQSPGVLILNGGLVSGNTALTIGGGIYARIANLTVNDTTISGNRARTNGGGIAGSQFGGTLSQVSLHRVLVHQNIAGATIDGQLSSGEGGGLWIVNSASVLSINQSQVTENVARRGAGIFRVASGPQGNLVLNGSTVSGNVAENQGGGLYNQGGLVAINVSTIANNVASIRTSTGGGIFNRNGDLTVSQSTISGNTAPEGRGGGIYHANGDLTVKLSTISGNFARQEGGGVWALTSSSDRITFHSSTISGNSAQVQTGAMTLRGQTTIRHSTITKNFVTGTSAGPAVSIVDASQAEIDHSIIAGNTFITGLTLDLVANNLPLANVRYSIIGNNQGTPLLPEAPLGSPDANGNLIGRPVEAGGNGVIDPLLAPLADNGGPTLTHAILPGSPALDGGAVVSGPPLGFDQRGNPFSRMVDGTGDGVVRIDVGAYESQGVPSFTAGDFNRDGLVDACDYTLWRGTLGNFVAPFEGCDANGDGYVGPEDYAIWKSHFGDGLQFDFGGGAALTLAEIAEGPLAVEEPAHVLLMPSDRSVSERGTEVTASSKAVDRADPTNDALVAWLADRTRTQAGDDDALEIDPVVGAESESDAGTKMSAFDAAFTSLGE